MTEILATVKVFAHQSRHRRCRQRQGYDNTSWFLQKLAGLEFQVHVNIFRNDTDIRKCRSFTSRCRPRRRPRGQGFDNRYHDVFFENSQAKIHTLKVRIELTQQSNLGLYSSFYFFFFFFTYSLVDCFS